NLDEHAAEMQHWDVNDPRRITVVPGFVNVSPLLDRNHGDDLTAARDGQVQITGVHRDHHLCGRVSRHQLFDRQVWIVRNTVAPAIIGIAVLRTNQSVESRQDRVPRQMRAATDETPFLYTAGDKSDISSSLPACEAPGFQIQPRKITVGRL